MRSNEYRPFEAGVHKKKGTQRYRDWPHIALTRSLGARASLRPLCDRSARFTPASAASLTRPRWASPGNAH
eukprot:5719258-Pleurochrysis_carterae.AAC.4